MAYPQENPRMSNNTAMDNIDLYRDYLFSIIQAKDWTTHTEYSLGSKVKPNVLNGYFYECIQAGTSSSTEPVWTKTVNNQTVDNDIIWVCKQILESDDLLVLPNGETINRQLQSLVSSVSGVNSFIELDDAPSSYNGQANKYVIVNPTESGLIFVTGTASSGGATVFTDLLDVPNNYSGFSNKFVKVKTDETGLEYSESQDLTLRTEVENVTANLQSQIDNKANTTDLNNYTLLTTTSELTGQLQSQINNIVQESTVIVPGYGISVTESPTQTWSIAVTGQFGDSTLRTEVENVTGQLQSQIDSFNIIAGSNITVYETPENTWTISAAISGGSTDHNTLANLQGGTTSQYYHLTQSQYSNYIEKTEVENVTGQLQSQINNIVQESTVIVPGYGISVTESPTQTWSIAVTGQFGDSTLRTEVENVTGNLQSQIDDKANTTELNNYTLLTTTSELTGNLQFQIDNIPLSDYTLLSTTAALTANLQSQINAISPVDTTNIVGGNGIQVIESPNDTFTISVSGSYASTSYVNTVSGNLQTQINTKPVEIGFAVSDETTNLQAGTSKLTFRSPYAFTLSTVRASVTTAPSGQTIIVDINENGSSILSTKLSIDIGEKTSTTAATPAVISDSTIADDSEITVDVDQVGSAVPGTGLKIWMLGSRNS
jgi:hypothetical protein